MMRVITGSARGRRLQSLPGNDTRPTSEVVKEAMMSVVQFEIEGARVLDLFAGTGQLGIEALSRGAASCTFVELSHASCKIIEENLTHTKLAQNARVVTADARIWVANTKDQFDLIFADPPYQSQLLEPMFPALYNLLAPGGALLCEVSSKETDPGAGTGIPATKSYRYGKKSVFLYRKNEHDGVIP